VSANPRQLSFFGRISWGIQLIMNVLHLPRRIAAQSQWVWYDALDCTAVP